MDKIELRKQINKTMREASKDAKRESCLVCGKSCSSFCNSHIIPQFILKSIADNGYVLQGISAFNNIDEKVFESKKGINNTWTFKVICNECDVKYFADYENEQALVTEPTTKKLAEIALKNSMMQLAKRYHEVALYKKFNDRIKQKDLLDEEHQLDIRDYLFDFKRAKKIIDNNLKSGYILLFYTILNYVTPIAMQGPIAVHRDLDGEIVNDINNFDSAIKMQQLHVGVFPLKKSTVILAFYHKDDRNYVKFNRKFNRLNFQEKLQYLNYLIFKYCEHFAIAPGIPNEVLNNKKLVNLAKEFYDSPQRFMMMDEMLPYYQQPLINWKDIPNLLDEQYKLRLDKHSLN